MLAEDEACGVALVEGAARGVVLVLVGAVAGAAVLGGTAAWGVVLVDVVAGEVVLTEAACAAVAGRRATAMHAITLPATASGCRGALATWTRDGFGNTMGLRAWCSLAAELSLSSRPLALRPRLTTGLPFSVRLSDGPQHAARSTFREGLWTIVVAIDTFSPR